jgi:hypothetical protein
MALLAAYFDKSGDVDGPLVSVAGYIAGGMQWECLDEKWKKAMGEAGVQDFHMSEFMTGHKRPESEFNKQDWPQVRRDQLMNKLTLTYFRIGFPVRGEGRPPHSRIRGQTITRNSYPVRPALALRGIPHAVRYAPANQFDRCGSVSRFHSHNPGPSKRQPLVVVNH